MLVSPSALLDFEKHLDHEMTPQMNNNNDLYTQQITSLTLIFINESSFG